MEKTFGLKNDSIQYKNRTSAYVIIMDQYHIGVVEAHKGFFLIGGEKRPHESNQECIKRECMEETGYELEIEEFLCSADAYEYLENLGYYHMVQYYYFGKLKVKTNNPIEIDHTYREIPIKEIQMALPMQSWAIKCALEKRKLKIT